jgi:hypothetical protein
MKLKLDTLIIVLALIVITGLAIVTIPKISKRIEENHQRKIYPYWFYDNAK